MVTLRMTDSTTIPPTSPTTTKGARSENNGTENSIIPEVDLGKGWKMNRLRIFLQQSPK